MKPAPETCGDGVVEGDEVCDDGNTENGDGCFNCRVETGWMCRDSNPPCPKEFCEDKSKYCERIEVLYGNGKIDKDFEDCDDGNKNDNDGCTKGIVDPGWICSEPGKPCRAKACGDGILAGDEECDDGNNDDGDGCSARCRLENGYSCTTTKQGKTNCKKGFCGDGIVQHGEECDDAHKNGDKKAGGKGCSVDCKIEPGYKCKSGGGACVIDKCGTATIDPSAGYSTYKTCDLGSDNGKGKGCSNTCRIESEYHCDANGKNCVKGKCGDGFLDVGEECDDGNTMPNDGCDPKCKREVLFDCYNGECNPICGDGITMFMLGEECDDGNLISGDGCSADCKIEPGFTCTDFESKELPPFIDIPVVYRDFRYSNDHKDDGGDGYLNQAFIDKVQAEDPICKNNPSRSIQKNHGFTDFQQYGGSGCYGILENELDADGKPVMKKTYNTGNWSSSKCDITGALLTGHYTCPGMFRYWYRDVEGINKSFNHVIRLKLIDKSKGKYQFDIANNIAGATDVKGNVLTAGGGVFTPINGYGYKDKNPVGGGFTSEVSTYFQYTGGATLDFSGDDDVWVFVNNKLFVDIGGMHGAIGKSETLKAEPLTVKNNKGDNIVIKRDPSLELYEGGIYEIKLFHAERMYPVSNFKLTLTGFLNTGKASCASICGDGIIASTEQCDIGKMLNGNPVKPTQAEEEFMGCKSCKKAPVCGNGIVEAGEVCDTGVLCKQDKYKDICKQKGISYKEDPNCNDKCRYDSCNDGKLDPNEDCDCKDGKCLFQSGFDKELGCLDTCKVPKCGDGIVQPKLGEECDNGEANGNNAACTPNCKLAKCGDGIVQAFLGEACDLGTDANGNSLNTGEYGTDGKPGCAHDCSFKTPYCGDGKVQANKGEQCDFGAQNDDNVYNGCKKNCTWGPRCGDGTTQKDNGEACDLGELNGQPGSGCSATCQSVVN